MTALRQFKMKMMSLHSLSLLLFVFMFFGSFLQYNIPSRGSVDIGDDPQSSLDTFLDTCVSLRGYLSYLGEVIFT